MRGTKESNCPKVALFRIRIGMIEQSYCKKVNEGDDALTREEPLRLCTSLLYLRYLNESFTRVSVSCKVKTEQEVALQLTGGGEVNEVNRGPLSNERMVDWRSLHLPIFVIKPRYDMVMNKRIYQTNS